MLFLDTCDTLAPLINLIKHGIIPLIQIGIPIILIILGMLDLGKAVIASKEDEIKKGMDSSQITGSVSSYARKYALNGMFAIDDTKDSDSTNTHGVGPDNNGPGPGQYKLSAKQVGRLLAIGLKAGIKEPEIKKVIKAEFGKDKIEDLSIEDYNSVCSRLEAKVK